MTAIDHSTPGLLFSLANALPQRQNALARRARRLARAFSEGAPTVAHLDAAAALLARLLDAADTSSECCYPEDGLLDAEWDA